MIDVSRMIEMYNNGCSAKTIAIQFSVSTSTVLRKLKQQGVGIRSNYKDRHKHRTKPKVKSPYAKGKNPGSHKGRNRAPSSEYTHRQGKYKYRKRLPPRRCCFMKKNGHQCGSWAIAGTKVCYYHGGRTIYTNATCGGLNSKALKRNILHAIITANTNTDNLMHFLSELTPDEIKAINSTDYSKLKILAAQHKLSDVLLKRALAFLNELELKLQNLNQQLQNPPQGADLQSLYITQATLLKNITATHTIISKHQETVGKLITTQEQVTSNLGVKASLNELTLEVSKDTLSILVDLIESYKAAGAFKNLEELKNYLPENPAFDIVDYELLDD